jgi:hypothetical protein
VHQTLQFPASQLEFSSGSRSPHYIYPSLVSAHPLLLGHHAFSGPQSLAGGHLLVLVDHCSLMIVAVVFAVVLVE